jgi:hypothetical protein
MIYKCNRCDKNFRFKGIYFPFVKDEPTLCKRCEKMFFEQDKNIVEWLLKNEV